MRQPQFGTNKQGFESVPATKRSEAPIRLNVKSATYRFEVPRAAFLTFCLSEPRGAVCLGFGVAFLRAARLIFFRSCPIFNLGSVCHLQPLSIQFQASQSFPLLRAYLFHVSRELLSVKARIPKGICRRAPIPAYNEAEGLSTDPAPPCSASVVTSFRRASAPHATTTAYPGVPLCVPTRFTAPFRRA